MNSFHSRTVRCALGVVLVALAACVDEPVAPFSGQEGEPQLTVPDPFTVSNANDSGIGSLRWVLYHTTAGETVRFDAGLAGKTIALDSAIVIKLPVAIEGPAPDGITIDGRGKGRVLEATNVPVVTLRNLTLTGGNAFSDNGGAVFGPMHLMLENSTLHGNQAFGSAAIYARKTTATNSTITGNTATPTLMWPVVWSYTVELINSTVAHNNMAGGIGAVAVTVGTDTLLIHNSVIAKNDGPSMTHALLAGNPAINAGTGCTVSMDQRFLPRDAQCDLGAFEFADFTTVAVTVASSATFDSKALRCCQARCGARATRRSTCTSRSSSCRSRVVTRSTFTPSRRRPCSARRACFPGASRS